VTGPAKQDDHARDAALSLFDRAVRGGAHGIIRGYQLTLSSLIGRNCRYWPSCSDYTDEAIRRHGLWAGGWMGIARICRCGPLGGSGIDIVCEAVPESARAWTPWRYGLWKGVNDPSSGQIASAPETGGPEGQRQRKE
jgi:putative membrane protein insertion efficiency factor